jgi:protein tyrosine phosphatase
VKPLLEMARLIRDCQASETLPVLVHCSAGCSTFNLLPDVQVKPLLEMVRLIRDCQASEMLPVLVHCSAG